MTFTTSSVLYSWDVVEMRIQMRREVMVPGVWQGTEPLL